jgi:hypothetical protein
MSLPICASSPPRCLRRTRVIVSGSLAGDVSSKSPSNCRCKYLREEVES